jgi:hypothetical protein
MFGRCQSLGVRHRAGQLIGMKDFLHAGPPLARRRVSTERCIGPHDLPLLLSPGISSHLRHVSVIICSVVLKIAEQKPILQENGEVADVALPDHGQHLGPHCGMIPPILVEGFRPQPDQ